MSLVAYASSDESDGEENEDVSSSAVAVVSSVSLEKRDEKFEPSFACKDDDNAKSEDINKGLDGTISDSDSDVESRNDLNHTDRRNIDDKDVMSLLKGLPEPKSIDHTSTSDRASTLQEKQEDELEEEVKPKLSQIKDAPKPPARKKVIITIPTLDKNDSDDEEQPKKKTKLAPSKGKSGLFSLLPDPIHTSVKATNRALIPHTLTKKPVQKTGSETKSLPSTKPQPTVSKIKGVATYSSDSEDSEAEESNFFSLGGSSEPDKAVSGPMLPQQTQSASSISKLSLPPPKNPVHEMDDKTGNPQIESVSSNEMNISDSSKKTDEEVEDSVNYASVLPNQDAPLTFKSSSQNATLSFKSGHWNTLSRPQQNRGYGYISADYSDTVNTVSSQEGMEFETTAMQGDQDFTKDEEFLKMQGKRRRNEDINIVDMNADDFIGNSALELTKSLSEETQMRSHSKKDGPTSQQKRKHQITYLAHQAKERELELKNTWSQNRMTKKQTQAKYGF